MSNSERYDNDSNRDSGGGDDDDFKGNDQTYTLVVLFFHPAECHPPTYVDITDPQMATTTRRGGTTRGTWIRGALTEGE